jgi:hypothetical protein
MGVVTNLIELPSCEALEVQPAGDAPVLLVPMVRDAIRSVDIAGRWIEVDTDFLDPAAPGGGAPGEVADGQDTGAAGDGGASA